jgi:hypothetical protein
LASAPYFNVGGAASAAAIIADLIGSMIAANFGINGWPASLVYAALVAAPFVAALLGALLALPLLGLVHRLIGWLAHEAGVADPA